MVGTGSRLITDLVAIHYHKAIPAFARGRLLDLGCGTVPLYESYKAYVTDNICVDWEHTAHPNIHLDCLADISTDLPFGDGVFDTVIMSDVLEHIAEPHQTWNEIARILSREGRLLLNVPFFYWIHEEPHDYYRYTEYALRRFADRSGLSILQLQPIGGVPEIVADIAAKTLQTVPVVGKRLAAFVQWVACVLSATETISTWSRSGSQTFPLGYFVVAGKVGL